MSLIDELYQTELLEKRYYLEIYQEHARFYLDEYPECKDDRPETSFNFYCKCGKTKGWITVGKRNQCPECKRVYYGTYNVKTSKLEAKE